MFLVYQLLALEIIVIYWTNCEVEVTSSEILVKKYPQDTRKAKVK